MNNFAMVKKIKPDYMTGPLRKRIGPVPWGYWIKKTLWIDGSIHRLSFNNWICCDRLAELFNGLEAVERIQINAHRTKPNNQAVKIYIKKIKNRLCWRKKDPETSEKWEDLCLDIQKYLFEEVGFNCDHKTEDEFWVEVEILD